MRRHEMDLVSLLSGTVLLVLALLYLGDVSLDARWALPVVLVTAGAAGIAASLNRARPPADESEPGGG
jgi:hypothetical protein